MDKTWRNHVIALAGVFQACKTVEQLAKTGYLKTDAFYTSVASLLVRDPETTESVFGGVASIKEGVETLIEMLENHRDPRNRDVLRYALGVLHLQKIVAKRSDILYIISSRLDKTRNQAEHFDLTHDNIVANIAEIYTDTISKMSYRIQVSGEYNYLQQQRVANQIRVLLFAAIRAAILWRQVGGSRWQFLFYRSRLITAAEELLASLQQPSQTGES